MTDWNPRVAGFRSSDRFVPAKQLTVNPVARFLAILVLGAVTTVSGLVAVDVPFQKSTVASGVKTFSTAAADVDGDGDTDVLGASFPDDEIVWWENTAGDGTAWTQHTVGGAFDGARWVYATDVDGDGDTDVLGAAFTADEVAWWENTAGDGTAWTKHTVDAAFDGARSVYAADVDGDGDTDVLGATFTASSVTWWENTAGDGTAWTEHMVDGLSSGSDAVFASDVDGDGDIDVIAPSSGSNEITWWENTAGDGTAWTKHTVDGAFSGGNSVYAADVDGDGDTDITASSFSDDTIAWWENTAGNGTTWTKHTVSASFDTASSVYAVDVDDDGDTDILGAGGGANEITWWENVPGDGETWTEHIIDASFGFASSVLVTDIDGDGDTDVLGSAFGSAEVALWKNETIHRSAVHPAKRTVDASFAGAGSAFAADVDGDGDMDVLGAAASSEKITWWENTAGDGSVWTTHMIDDTFLGASSVYATDVDGDGDTDVLGAAYGASGRALGIGGMRWWENTVGDGSVWATHSIDGVFDFATSVFAADVDGDGDIDVLGAADTTPGIIWWENTAGDGSAWTAHTVGVAFVGATSVYAADVDGDGDTDVLGTSYVLDDIAWWENTAGDGSAWTLHTVEGLFVGASSVFASDVDGDSDIDILGSAFGFEQRGPETRGIAWWENTAGDGSAWTLHTVEGNFVGASSVFASDVDGDGDADVLGSSLQSGSIIWWENTVGNGSAWLAHTVDDAFGGAFSVFASDVDGDGDPDALGAAVYSGDIAWWENRGGQFALPTVDVAPLRFANGSTVAALAIDAIHRGRPDDQDVELATLELLLEDGTATALTDSQADDLLAQLALYLDDGDGTFDAGTDTQVIATASFGLSAGVLSLDLVDLDPNVQVAYGTPRKYFVALTFEVSASAATPKDIRLTHLTESSSTGEDAEHDLPLILEYASDVASAVMEANTPPVAVADTAFLLEDSGTVEGNVLDGSVGGLDSDPDNDPLNAVLSSGPSNGVLIGSLSTDGSFVYQPNPNFVGIDSFTYRADDGFELSNAVTVTITVDPVNDAPSFDLTSAAQVDQNLGPQSFTGFAFNVNPGPADEAAQTLTFIVTGNTAPALFSAGPILANDGTLTFTSAPGAVGVATLTVRLMDDGGTASGGVDTSAPRDFEIAITLFSDGFESGDVSSWSSTSP